MRARDDAAAAAILAVAAGVGIFEGADRSDAPPRLKGGKHVTIRDLRAMQGVLDNDEALMASLIIMDPLGPTKDGNFHRDMGAGGGPGS